MKSALETTTVISELLGAGVSSVERMSGGRNNQVYSVNLDSGDRYVAEFYFGVDGDRHGDHLSPGSRSADGFRYDSETNSWWLSDQEIAALTEEVKQGVGDFDIPVAAEPNFIVGG